MNCMYFVEVIVIYVIFLGYRGGYLGEDKDIVDNDLGCLGVF